MNAPRLKTRPQTSKVTHPKFESIVITVQRLGRKDLFEYYALNEAREEYVLVKDGAEVLRDAKGEPVTRVKQHYSIDNVIGLLRKVVIGWEGLVDEDNATIPFSPDRVDLLIDEALDFEEDVVDAAGNKKPTTRLFWQYVFERSIDPKQFDRDPNAAR